MPDNTQREGFWRKLANWLVEFDRAMQDTHVGSMHSDLKSQAQRIAFLEKEIEFLKGKDDSDVLA